MGPFYFAEVNMSGWFEGIVRKMGFQRWVPDETDRIYDKQPTDLAQKNIEDVKRDELGKWVFDVCDYAEYARDNHYLNNNWTVARNLYNGDGWIKNDDERAEWRSKIISNWCAEHVRSRASYVTSNNMTCYAYAVQSRSVEIADFARDIIQHVFYINSFNNKDYEANVDAGVTGTTYFKISWDPDLSPPYGDVSIKHCEPSRIITDWDVEDMQKGRFAGEVYYMSPNRVKKLWPTKFMKIQDAIMLKEQADEYEPGGQRPNNTMKVVELYAIDTSTEKIVEIHQTMTESGIPEDIEVEVEVPKYENGRRIIVVEGVVVQEISISATLRQNGIRFPIVALRGIVQPHEQYGKSYVLEYEPICREIIKRESHISDILNLYAHPVTRAPKGAFNNPAEEAIIGDDILWEYNARHGIPPPDIMTPPSGLLTGHIQQSSMLKGDYQFLSGMNDISMGNTPGSVQSGRGILALQQRVDIRNTPMLKEHSNAITQVAKAVFAFVQSGYEAERVVRHVNEHGQASHTSINVPGEGEEEARINDPQTGLFDITFDVASSAPNNYVARSEEARNWAQQGLMGPITAIGRSDIPNKTEAIREAIAMSGNPLLVLHAVTSGYLSEDDPLVQMVLGAAQQEAQAQQQQVAQEEGPGPGVTDPSLTASEMMQ